MDLSYNNMNTMLLSKNLDDTDMKTILLFGVAFAALILIIQLIYVFKIIPNRKGSNAAPVLNEGYADDIVARISEQEDAVRMDQNELIAVITAAIYASMKDTIPADGFIVRSIRKIDSRRR